MAQKRRSRSVFTLGSAAVLLAVLAFAFRPQPMLVDIGTVSTGPMRVTINEEGRTLVQEPYVVSAPVSGELQRVTVQPGDTVVRGETIVARMRPANPSALDVRTREQALAAVTAAEAGLRVARADLNAALANRDFAASELERIRQLVEREIASQVVYERAEQSARVADANVDTVEAAIAMREAELQNARAQLIGFDDQGIATALAAEERYSRDIPLTAPSDGTILQIIQKSEITLPAGAPILEIGDVRNDLEVVAELLSSDAVQVTVGDPVIVTNWGGSGDLMGVVHRIDPYGFTKYSALGVEEQRVDATIRFVDPPEARPSLGHGYRVEVRIVVWEGSSVVRVPSAALFRSGTGWSVFEVVEGRAALRPVEVGQNNGIEAEILDGLQDGAEVVLYPSSGLSDGQRVAQRKIEA